MQPDERLTELAQQYAECVASLDRLGTQEDFGASAAERDAATAHLAAVDERMREIEAEMARLPAETPSGDRAKARVVLQALDLGGGSLPGEIGAVLRSLLTSLAARH